MNERATLQERNALDGSTRLELTVSISVLQATDAPSWPVLAFEVRSEHGSFPAVNHMSVEYGEAYRSLLRLVQLAMASSGPTYDFKSFLEFVRLATPHLSSESDQDKQLYFREKQCFPPRQNKTVCATHGSWLCCG